MVNKTGAVQLFVLGDLAKACGKLGPIHSRTTKSQMAVAGAIVTDPNSYTNRLSGDVVCVEDRLHRPNPRLAGGAVSLGLIHNLIYGGAHLSADFRELKAQGIRIILHDDCGALKLAMSIVKDKLSDADADGYKLLSAMGVDVPMLNRRRIAAWAINLPKDYVDDDAARAMADEIDQVQGEHNAVFAAISRKDGVSFTGGLRLKRATNGLLAFTFDPWVARRSAQRIAVSREDAAVAEALALVFTAQVFLALGGPDLRVALYG